MTSTQIYKFRRGEKWRDQHRAGLQLQHDIAVIYRDVRRLMPKEDITQYTGFSTGDTMLLCEDLIRRPELRQ